MKEKEIALIISNRTFKFIVLFSKKRYFTIPIENFTFHLNRNEIGSPRALYLILQVFKSLSRLS